MISGRLFKKSMPDNQDMKAQEHFNVEEEALEYNFLWQSAAECRQS